ncbi:MAG TPA: chemotaxis protein CheW [Polyangia bacterium]
MQIGDAARQYLTFFLGDEEYAVAILRLKQILDYRAPTRVPAVPPCIRGVINLRGLVVPVIDLAAKFGAAARAPGRTTCIVIVELAIEGAPALMGVIADRVHQVIELGDGDVEPPPPFGTRVRVDFLVGVGKLDDRFVLLLDIDKVLSQHELWAAGELAAAPPDGGDA